MHSTKYVKYLKQKLTGSIGNGLTNPGVNTPLFSLDLNIVGILHYIQFLYNS